MGGEVEKMLLTSLIETEDHLQPAQLRTQRLWPLAPGFAEPWEAGWGSREGIGLSLTGHPL